MEKKETAELEILMKAPGTFPLEKLLVIFQCLTSVAEYSPGEEGQGNRGTIGESCDSGLMSSVLCPLGTIQCLQC